ncbi:cytosolic protein [Priestia flexa]|uniref:cytosolic protein n=1 Tax=Priestia flexa TaxID=86664 RepID=UPI003D2EEA3B
MGIIQKVKSVFSNHSETRDHHENPKLQTHYYKSTASQTFTQVQNLLKNMNGVEILAAYEERGEISLNVSKGRKAFVVITIISLRPFETAIDFSVTTESKVMPFDFGYSKELIIFFYQHFDQHLIAIK